MAGYSGTPLPQKLGIKAGYRVALLGAPSTLRKTLGKLPGDVSLRDALSRKPGEAFDVILQFVTARAELKQALPRLIAALEPNGGLWVCWPKKASGVATDMTEDVVRELALPKGLVDNKVCAIDDTWSGLRCVIRLENRSVEKTPSKKASPKG